MAKNDDQTFRSDDILDAMHLLSRLPLPMQTGTRGAGAAWAYPLVGLVIGALAAGIGLLGHALGLPAPLCAPHHKT